MLDEYLERSRAALTSNGKRVLVVDDDHDTLDALARCHVSHRFCGASDDLQVGMRLVDFSPHLAVVNTHMKGLDARRLCQRLSMEQPGLAVLTFEKSVSESGAVATSDYERSHLRLLEERIGQVLANAPPGAL
jgi:PleD family two-component response regulator